MNEVTEAYTKWKRRRERFSGQKRLAAPFQSTTTPVDGSKLLVKLHRAKTFKFQFIIEKTKEHKRIAHTLLYYSNDKKFFSIDTPSRFIYFAA